MKLFKKILSLLPKKEKWNLTKLYLVITISTIFELLGILSIFPILALITDPVLLEKNKFYQLVQNIINSNDLNLILILLIVISIIVFSLHIFLKVFVLWYQNNYVYSKSFKYSFDLLSSNLSNNYEWFLNKNSSSLTKDVLDETNILVQKVFNSLIIFFSSLTYIFFVILLVFLFSDKRIIFAIFLVSVPYLIIFKFLSNYLKKIGSERFEFNEKRFFIVKNIFDGIKEIKAFNLEKKLQNNFGSTAKKLSEIMTNFAVISMLPRYLLELVFFVGIMVITIIFLLTENSSLNKLIPTFAILGLFFLRAIPPLQNIFKSFSDLKFNTLVIEKMIKSYKIDNLNYNLDYKKISPIEFNKNITLRNVTFNYSNNNKNIFEDLSLEIKKNNCYGIIGASGAGKTTLVDIILGLLVPKKGEIFVDGKKINTNLIQSYRKIFSYIPQNCFLTNDSIKNNIILNRDTYDQNLFDSVTKIAEIKEFINGLSNKENTLVGDRGSNLSGGQKQRIGIARALYNNSNFLIFDEATNALDSFTEERVLNTIFSLKDKTKILISHKTSNLKNCDEIIVLDKGLIKFRGKYDMLIKNQNFNFLF